MWLAGPIRLFSVWASVMWEPPQAAKHLPYNAQDRAYVDDGIVEFHTLATDTPDELARADLAGRMARPLEVPKSMDWTDLDLHTAENLKAVEKLKQDNPNWSGWFVAQKGKIYGVGQTRDEAYEMAEAKTTYDPKLDRYCSMLSFN